ncbi:MAG TPA: acyltransferase [Kiritimatiellia bacterium]|nr:acyltransferase [Kiritimatiellia bacterium]
MTRSAAFPERLILPAMPPPNRLYSLDVLRGVAALLVVFCHWQNFFMMGVTSGEYDVIRMPGFSLIGFLYENAWMAVDFFFCLSGFVFHWLYGLPVSKGRIVFGRFAALRLSRLYPLHLATLMLVALGQWGYLLATGTYFAFHHQDIHHFVLNVLFASSWGFESGYSFNGPIWSVSVEMFLYGIFFFMCRRWGVRTVVMMVFAISGFTWMNVLYAPLGRGITGFFVGGLAYVVYQYILHSRHARRMELTLSILLMLMIGLVLAISSMNESPSLRAIPGLWRLEGVFQWLYYRLPMLVLFPVVILVAALVETRVAGRGRAGLSWRKGAVLGDVSYAVYLLHFPLQLVMALFLVRMDIDHDMFYAPWFIISFFTLLVFIAWLTYRRFELPTQSFIRKQWMVRREC